MRVFVLDHTALAALGRGSHQLSSIVARLHSEPGWRVYVPALCLAAAESGRPGLADHLGALPAVEVVDLGYAAASELGKLVAAGVDWKLAHAVDTGRPALDWPDGRPVVTAEPDSYLKWGVTTVALAN